MPISEKNQMILIYQSRLKASWMAWLLVVLLIYPLVVFMATQANFWAGVGVQLLGLMPALLFTPSIWRAKSAYGLILASIVTLVYLGFTGVKFVLRAYEQVPSAIIAVLGVEFLCLLAVNVLLFMLLKKMPAMHKQNKKTI